MKLKCKVKSVKYVPLGDTEEDDQWKEEGYTHKPEDVFIDAILRKIVSSETISTGEGGLNYFSIPHALVQIGNKLTIRPLDDIIIEEDE